jgi:hypothetical protein
MKPIVKAAAWVLVAGMAWYHFRDGAQVAAQNAQPAVTARSGDGVREAFEQQARGRMLQAAGRVERILADDRDESPHQRFIIATDSGVTVLVAHNLDLAPRLNGLARGDQVTVYGEYEWNPQGGVLHWTHDDPQGRHAAGYIEWQGRKYQ